MNILSREQLDELRKFDTPTICNAVECFNTRTNIEGYMRPGMFLRTKDKTPVIGYAATARVSAKFSSPNAQEMLMGYYEHVRNTAAPSISVIQDIDPEPVSSFWGEVQATIHRSLGCVGTIMQGGVRDIEEASAMGFHFYSTEINVSHGYIHVERYNCPVHVLGLTVNPGDLLHMDQHGVVNIPHEVAPRLAEACREIVAAEFPVLEPCRTAIAEGRKPSVAEISRWFDAMTDARQASAKKFSL